MPRRTVIVTQAEAARTMRAMLQVGLKIARVVTRPDGVSIETTDATANNCGVEISTAPAEGKSSIVL